MRVRHRALAEAYEASPSTEPETLAVHFRACGDASKALRYTEIAGDAAVRALAFDHAAELYETAIRLANVDERYAFRVKRADALSKSGRPWEAAAAFVSAMQSQWCDAELIVKAGDELVRAGDIEHGLAYMRRAAKMLGESFPKRKIEARLALLYRGLRLGGAHRPRLSDRPVPAKIAQRLALHHTCARGLIFVDFVLASLFHLRYLALALESGARENIVQGLAAQAGICAQLPAHIAGGIPRAKRLLEQTRELARESDSTLVRATVRFAPGVIALAEGRWTVARAALESVIGLLEGSGAVAWDIALCQVLLLETLWHEGNLKEMRDRQQSLVREAKGNKTVGSINTIREGLLLALCEDAPREGRRRMAEAIASWPSEPWRIVHHFDYLGQSEIDLYEGMPSSANERIRSSRALVRRAGFDQVCSHADQYTILKARTALALSDRSGAQREIDFLVRRPDGWARAIGLALQGCLSLNRGDYVSARKDIREAIPLLASWNVGLYLAAARYRFARIAGDVQGADSALHHMSRLGVRMPERLVASLLPTTAR
jgi:hypothetical protein